MSFNISKDGIQEYLNGENNSSPILNIEKTEKGYEFGLNSTGVTLEIRDYADETDKLIFLGDAIDRGPDGLKILQEILADDRITFLKGNHEDFLTRYGKDEMIIGLWTCSNNGGKPTYEALKAMNREDRVQLIDKVKKLPLYIAYENKRGQLIYLSHAGFTPWENMYFFEDDLLWDRNHFYEDWPQEEQYENVYVVHGHTPAIVVAYRLGQEIDKDIDEDFNITD